MELYENAIQTDRAFIYFNKIAHISWKETNLGTNPNSKRMVLYEVKIYSDAGVILQNMTPSEYHSFIRTYKENVQKTIVRDVTGIDINGDIHGY